MTFEDAESEKFHEECIATFREVAATGRSPEPFARELLESGADPETQAREFLQLLIVAQFAAEEAANTLAALVGIVAGKCSCPDCTGTAKKRKVN